MSSMGDDSTARQTRIRQIVSQYAARSSTDATVCPDDFIQQHPELMPELGEALTNHRLVAQARQDFLQRPAAGLPVC